jgi:competence protein ComEC
MAAARVPFAPPILPNDGSVSLTEKVRGWAAAEAGPGRLLPWVPVAFGAGIAIYFAADREPIAWVTAIIAVAFCVAAFAARRSRMFPLIVMLAALAAGFAVAALKRASPMAFWRGRCFPSP